MNTVIARREVASRNTALASRVAVWLKDAGLRPNQLSVASVVFAFGASISMIVAFRMHDAVSTAVIAGAAVFFVVLRLLCNLFDGMIAIEGGLKSASGEIYNDFPDRPSDLLIIVGAGYAATSIAWSPELGWCAGTLAVVTAYVRLLGGASGARQHFSGPMAKQHRMAVIIAAIVVAVLERASRGTDWALTAALGVIALGSLVTTVVRLRAIVRDLESA